MAERDEAMRDSNDMNLDDDEYRDMVKRWVRGEIMAGRLPPDWVDAEAATDTGGTDGQG